MSHETSTLEAEILIHNANVVTMDKANPMATAVAIRGDRFLAVGNDTEVMQYKGSSTKVIDANKRLLIPGLNDSHIHLIRGGLNFN